MIFDIPINVLGLKNRKQFLPLTSFPSQYQYLCNSAKLYNISLRLLINKNCDKLEFIFNILYLCIKERKVIYCRSKGYV